ncbi:DUF5681 domain-containing protein [Mariprofundus sp. KV]|uniref:DUF5681 domain-containing protein n=1 Tax=Mariprofundus sp. KV TaxID=2608715 RepID=UPI0015A2DDF1|nr:DUF5681 domain-containing protein [Mariprofundus sp. KV]NWF35890.1 hypothetical protein [Mariprofundus sp. KV]
MGYEVGYRRPPKGGQFKKGQSGNPNGRPKGSKNFMTILAKELNQKVVVNENGKKKKISRMEAMVKRLVSEALQGDRRSLLTLLEMMRKTGQLEETDIQGLIPDDYEDILDTYVESRQGRRQKTSQEKTKENES